MRFHAILVAIGSAGDTNPLLGLGQRLSQRGHRVTIITSPHFTHQVAAAGLDLAPLGTAEQFDTLTKDPTLWQGARGTRRVMSFGLLEPLIPTYDAIAARYEPGRTVVVAGTLGLGARLAHEKLGVPLVSMHLQPTVFLSAYDPPRLPGPPLHALPLPLRKAALRLVGIVADGMACPRINAARRDLGLPPVRGLTRWWHAPDRVLAMFPAWFAEPQPDWPPQTRLVGFPLHDDTDAAPMPPRARAFLDARQPPIVLTPGSANRHAAAFFAAGIEACRRLERRALLLTRYPEQLPSPLPDHVAHFDYLPLSHVLPRCAAVAHHGGIGTLSQAMAAGVPQIVMPMGHDQFDNAARARRLGVAEVIGVKRFTPSRVAGAIARLTVLPRVRERCEAVRQQMLGGDALTRAADEVEAVMRQNAAMPVGASAS
jgi:rhamnosyltransferase subunit B